MVMVALTDVESIVLPTQTSSMNHTKMNIALGLTVKMPIITMTVMMSTLMIASKGYQTTPISAKHRKINIIITKTKGENIIKNKILRSLHFKDPSRVISSSTTGTWTSTTMTMTLSKSSTMFKRNLEKNNWNRWWANRIYAKWCCRKWICFTWYEK